YRMNFAELLATHRQTQADVTIAVVPVGREETGGLGVGPTDEAHRLTRLVEKPREDALLDELRAPRLARPDREYPADLGHCAVRREVLLGLLSEQPGPHDLVTGLFAPSLAARRVQAHLFTGYWQDVGTLPAYYEANLALAGDEPPFDFHTPEGVIYTHRRNLP